MKLASIEIIHTIQDHPAADRLEIAFTLGYKCIVAKGVYKVGQKIIFIFPDSVLPDKDWAKIYKARSNRVKAIKLRGKWSEGVIESLAILGKVPQDIDPITDAHIGYDVSGILGITKYETPEPQDLNAKGGLPFGIPITDEENFQKVTHIPFGQKVNVTLKRDGKSWTAFAVHRDGQIITGICGRRLEYKLDSNNDYTHFKQVLYPLTVLARATGKSIAIRGEITGSKIQAFKNNPHAVGERQLNLFSVYLVDERRYARKNDPLNIYYIAACVNLPTVELLEQDVSLTPDMIKKYAEDLTNLNGQPFEGVVINGEDFSFKVVNKDYDNKK